MIRHSAQNAISTITIDRPEKRNALTTTMLRDLRAAFAASTSARCIILQGTGPVFCAGFDLLENAPDPALRSLRDQLQALADVLDTMHSLDVPIIAALQGAAIAGGCALLGSCDIVIADAAAKLGYPVVRLGISPAVTAPYLTHSVSFGAARAMMLDPRLLTAAEAQHIGLVTHIVDSPAHLQQLALTLASSFTQKPRSGIAATRAWLRTVAPALAPQLATEASLAAINHETLARLQNEVWKQ